MRTFIIVTILFSLLTAGCALPMKSEDVQAVVNGLAQDHASFCVVIGAWYGGGVLSPMPAVPLAGGRGHIIVGRSNEPGTKVTVSIDTGCVIEHGAKSALVP